MSLKLILALKELQAHKKEELRKEIFTELEKLMPIGTVFTFGHSKFIIIKYNEKNISVYDRYFKCPRKFTMNYLMNAVEICGVLDSKWLEQFLLML